MTNRPRKAITLATKVAVLLSQARCARCGEVLGNDVEWNHVLAHALGGSDGPENIEAVHKACHAVISDGTKATTAGSTKQIVAKSKRILRKRAEAAGESKRKARAKIPSRGFPKPPEGFKHRWPKRKVGQ